MLLSKVNSSRAFVLWKAYSAWLIFYAIMLIMTNGLASLTLIRDYRFSVIDVGLTYGFLIFLGIIEVVVVAMVLVLTEVLIEKIFQRRLDLVFRVILVLGLVGILLFMLLTILRIV
jgi:hypothetical protein